jgi:adenylate cyclase
MKLKYSIIIFFLLLLNFCSFNSKRIEPPYAKKGVLNLNKWDLSGYGPVYLTGEWEFYWNKFLYSSDFNNGNPELTEYLKLPGVYQPGKIKGQKLPSYGYYTYRLLIINSSSKEPLALKLSGMINPHTLFVNGKLITTSGITGTSTENSVPGKILPKVVEIEPDKTIEIILHGSHFFYTNVDIQNLIQLGTRKRLYLERDRRLITQWLIFGSLLIMGLYHLSIYFLRRVNPSTLFFGLFCILISLYNVYNGERYLLKIFEWISLDIWYRIMTINAIVAVFIFCLFIRSIFENTFKLIVVKALGLISLFFTAISLFTHHSFYMNIIPVYHVVTIISALYVLFVLIVEIRGGSKLAVVLISGFVVFFVSLVNDLLLLNNIINSIQLIQFGVFIFIFSQSFALATSYTTTLHEVETLSIDLKKSNFLLNETNRALNYFVPHEFLDMLQKNSITDISLGDHVLKEMSVLFSDIRSFTTLSEKMNPQENFNFLNSYLDRISPAIQNHKGFIDKYMGDAVMALFSGNPENALKAGIEMQTEIKKYNIHRSKMGYENIRIGIGIHFGKMILGTIGHKKRMDTTVISDVVNLVARLESLTKNYGAGIIISEELLSHIEDPSKYTYRILDRVVVLGRTKPISIVEVFDGLHDEEYRKKTITKEDFEKGITLYQQQNFENALELFNQVF